MNIFVEMFNEKLEEMETQRRAESYRKMILCATIDHENAFASLKNVMETRKKTALFILESNLTEENYKTAMLQLDFCNDAIKNVLAL